jgi:hypothetical protein
MCVYKIKYKWSSGRLWQISLEMKGRCSVRPPGAVPAVILESAGCQLLAALSIMRCTICRE